MAKCPKCGSEAAPNGFDTKTEMRIAYCSKCNFRFYESGLMFTLNTVLPNDAIADLEANKLSKGINCYEGTYKELLYENEMRLTWIENFLSLNSNCRFLDVGCGYGNLPILFALKYKLKQANGLDINSEYVKVGAEKAEKLCLDNVKFDCGSIYNLPYKDKQFTHLVCAEALEHLTDPIKAIKEMKRVTESCIVIQIPTPNPLLLNSAGKIYQLLTKNKVYHVESPKVIQNGEVVYPLHVFEPSAIEFIKYVKACGLHVEKYVGTRLLPIPFSMFNCETVRQLWKNVMRLNDYNLSKVWPIKVMANQLIIKAVI